MKPVTQFGMALTVAALMMAACGHDEAPPSPPAQPGPYFSVFPVAEADYTHIVPLGNLNPTGHTLPTDHFYIYIRPGPPNTPAEVAVVAPGDIVITLGAGDVHLCCGELLELLRQRPQKNAQG